MRYPTPSAYSAAIAGMLALLACGGGAGEVADADIDADAPTTEATPIPLTYEDAPALEVWVDRLSVRAAPASDAAVVTRLAAGTTLTPTGQRGGHTEAIVLRGGLYEDDWVGVATPDGERGYVFGGGVRLPGADEGKTSSEVRTGVLDHEHFGRFDLREWRRGSTEDTGSPEVDAERTTYRKADRRLELEQSSMGESYYGNTQTLRDGDGEVLRRRRFSATSEADGSRLEELVLLREGSRPRAYRRRQTTRVHLAQLPEQPSRVAGAWEQMDVSEAATELLLDDLGRDRDKSDVSGGLLLGHWRSVDDPRSSMAIGTEAIAYYYDGEPSGDPESYNRAATCPTDAAGMGAGLTEAGAFLVIDDGEGQRCLYLLDVTETTLEVSNVGAGNLLLYLRE